MSTVATIPVSSLRRPAPVETKPGRWSVAEVQTLYELPFMELMFRAQQVHREHFDPSEVQLSTLLSIKTGGCAE
ncbi:biotin synthase, partial [Azohydromonas sp. G-1-1-14]|nr:biotin synthase [Azohydromonas caseinilytica]